MHRWFLWITSRFIRGSRGLVHQPTRILEVDVDGMELHIPPAEMRKQILGPKDQRHQPKISLLVSQIRCKNVKLFIDTTKPGKDPMEFDIQKLDLQDVGQRNRSPTRRS